MTGPHKPSLLILDDRVGVRGVIRRFIEATTPYKVCDAVDDGVSAVHKAMEARCDLILLNLSMPLQDSLVTASLLRRQLPHVKIVGFSASSVDLGNRVSPGTRFDAVLTHQDGLSKLVATLKALMPEPSRE
jgi:DNA-binding NarL/FixJ family response regulator